MKAFHIFCQVLITFFFSGRSQNDLDYRVTSFHNAAIYHEKLGQLSEAISKYKEAIQLQRTFAPSHQNLAMIYEKTGDRILARRHFKFSIEYSSSVDFKAGAIARFGNFELATLEGKGSKSYSKLLRTLSSAKKSLPPNTDVLQILGVVYNKIGQQKKSYDVFNELLDLEPSHYFALLNIGNYFYNLGEYKKSTAFYTDALGNVPDYDQTNRISLLHNLGQSLAKINGAGVEALGAFASALKVR